MRHPIACLSTAALLVALAGAPGAAADRFDWKAALKKPDGWFRSDEARRIAANLRSWQSDAGSWPKNQDNARKPYDGDRAKLKGTFDNGATVGEVRFLTRMYAVTRDEADAAVVRKAVDHILEAQYPSGGWPQYHPPGSKYNRYVTFNDGTMVNLLELARDIGRDDAFAFLGQKRRAAARKAFEAGIAFILKSQIVVDGERTVWCAQHDPVTLEPRPARTFEPVSLSGGESAGILRLLMSLEEPSPEVVRAIDAGARWYERAKLTGIRETKVDGDKRIVADPDAPALWARFYEIGTNRPLFCGRDSVIKYDIREIEKERRNGYAWYGTWGKGVLETHARWRKRQGD